MGNPYGGGWTGMAGYVQRLKEDAERKKREEEQQAAQNMARQQSLSAWRRDVPIGPPTQAQALSLQTPIGPPTKKEAIARGYKPKPLPEFNLAQPKQPTFEVGPTQSPITTAVPDIQESARPSPTVPSALPQINMPQVQLPRYEFPSFRAQARPEAQGGMAPAQQLPPLSGQAALDRWRLPQLAPKGTAAIQPLAPTILPQVLGPIVQQGIEGIGKLGQTLGNIDWGSPQTWQQGLNLTGLFPQPGTGPREQTPADVALDMTRQQMGRRFEEKKYTNILPAQVEGVLAAPINFALSMADVLGAAAQIALSQPIVRGGKTAGQLLALTYDVGQRLIEDVEQTPAEREFWHGRQLLPALDTRVWANVANIATYWDAANKHLTDILKPTPSQVAGSTAQQLAAANNLAIFMAQFGVGSIEKTFDDYLDYPIQAGKLMQRASEAAQLADSQQDPDLRTQMYAEAGRISAQAVKLRETTALDLYNKNANWYYGLASNILFDPLQAWGAFAAIGGLTTAARRAKQGQVLAEAAYAAEPGFNRRLIDMFKDNPVVEWTKLNRSKAATDSYTNFSVMGNLLSYVSTKGDILTTLTKYLDGSLLNNQFIREVELNGPEIAMQAANGLVDLGLAGVKDWRAVKAKKSIEGVIGWLANLPSLQGDPLEIANKFDVQADLLGMLMRAGSQHFGVSTMPNVPWGAVRFEVAPMAGNQAVVNYLDEAKNILGQSAELSLNQATKLQGDLQKALRSGEELRRNWVKTVGDFRRNIMSTYSININPGNILANAMGGNITPMLDRAFDMEFFRPVDDMAEYVLNKTGGLFPEARLAEGYGRLQATAVPSGSQAVPTGQYDNIIGKLLNWSTFGLAKKGRELRQGAATLAGGRIKVGEEAMVLNTYVAAFKSFFEQEWLRVLEPKMQQVLAGRVEDPQVVKWMIDQVVQAGLAGNRLDIARTFQEIANGRIALSLRSVSPVIGEVLSGPQVLEMDDLLRNLNTSNLADVNRRMAEIFQTQRELLEREGAKALGEVTRRFFTEAHDSKDVADVVHMFQNAAEMSGRNVDEAIARGQVVRETLRQTNEQFLELMKMSQGQPGAIHYLYDVWGQISDYKDEAREAIGRMSQTIGELYNPRIGPAIPEAMRPQVAQAWSQHFDSAQAAWDDFANQARAAIERARTALLDGTALAHWQQGTQIRLDGLAGAAPGYSQLETTATELLSDLSVNMDEVNNWLKVNVGWASRDPAWEAKIRVLRKGVDAQQAKMFMALFTHPNMASFDEFMHAFDQVKVVRSQVLGKLKTIHDNIARAEAAADPTEAAKWYAILKKANNEEWGKYWKYASERFLAGAYRILEVNFNPELLDQLRFTPYLGEGEWTLRGPSLLQPKLWDVIAADGRKTTLPATVLPKAILEKYNEIRKLAELELMEQVGRLGAVAGTQETGAPAVGELLSRMGDKGTTEILNTVRRQVAEFMANYTQPNFIPTDLPRWYLEKLNQGELALRQVLQEVAVANSQGHGRLGLDAIAEFNRNVLPLFDNVVTGAKRYGKEMLSIGMIDFANQYHPDTWLGLFAPYHYWWSRMSKNALERMLFNPKVSQLMAHGLHALETVNRADEQPTRNLTSIPGSGPTIGGTDYRIGATLIPKWVPFFPMMTMNGWANPDRANRGYEYMHEAAKEQGWPATAKGLAGNAMVLHELANQLGFGTYPEWDALFDYAAGIPVTMQGKLGDMSSLFRTLGYGAVHLAQWAKENKLPLVQKVSEGVARAGVPSYFPYMVGREAAFEAYRGELTDPQAKMVQDVGRQQYSGLEPLPEQAVLFPQAQEAYDTLKAKVALEYFFRNLISWATGAPIAAVYGPEKPLQQAKEEQARMAYDEARNPAGSQAAYYSAIDPESANYTPGLAPYKSKYAVTAETAPQQPDQEVERPGLGAAQTAYYSTGEAIDDKYEAEAAQAYALHPEWAEMSGAKAKAAFDKDLAARKQAEKDKLKEEFPTVTAGFQEFGAEPAEVARPTEKKTVYSTYAAKEEQAAPVQGPAAVPPVEAEIVPAEDFSNYAARPAEIVRSKQDDLVGQAYEGVANLKPLDLTDEEKAALSKEEKAARNKAYDVWNSALEAELTTLLADPKNKVAGQKWTNTAAELLAANRNKNKPDIQVETEKELTEKFAINSQQWDEYHALGKDNTAKRAYLLSHPDFAAAYLAYTQSVDPDAVAWWEGEGRGRGDEAAGFGDTWAEYRALGEDWDAKAAYMLAHPEFAKYYIGKYGKDAAWWLQYTPRAARAAFVPRSYSYSRGGGGGGSRGQGGGYGPQYIRAVETLRLEPPRFRDGSAAGGGDWRKYLALGEVNLKGWRR